jgi:hypothetical protein
MPKATTRAMKWTIQQVGTCDENIKSRDDKKDLKSREFFKNVFNGMERFLIHALSHEIFPSMESDKALNELDIIFPLHFLSLPSISRTNEKSVTIVRKWLIFSVI